MTYFEPQTITFEAALRDLETGNDRARVEAATALGDVSAPDERERAVEALIRATSELLPPLRAAAATSLGELGGDRAVDALVLLLDDGVPHVRQSAAIALGRTGSERGFEPLERLLHGGPPDLRFQAATSLVEIDAERAFGPLSSRLAVEEDAEVIGALALSLGAIGDPRAADALARHLGHKRPQTRFDVAYGLARLHDERAARILVEFLDDRDHAWDAIEGLELSRSSLAAAPLTALLGRRLLDRDLRLRAAGALLALGVGGEAENRARTELLEGLSAWKHHQRALAVELLGATGGRWAVEPLRALKRRRGGRALASEIDAALARIEGARA